MTTFSDMQLDALRELANIGSGNAGTALSSMLGKPVDISVPTAAALPLDEAVAIAGEPDALRYGVVVPIVGDFEAIVLLLFPEDDARKLCAIYGIEPSTEDGFSMLGEGGNMLGTNYISVPSSMVVTSSELSHMRSAEFLLTIMLSSTLIG